jgi:hypothetical protein
MLKAILRKFVRKATRWAWQSTINNIVADKNEHIEMLQLDLEMATMARDKARVRCSDLVVESEGRRKFARQVGQWLKARNAEGFTENTVRGIVQLIDERSGGGSSPNTAGVSALARWGLPPLPEVYGL